MSTGRFNRRHLLYTAGKKARERGTKCSNTKFKKLEEMRAEMSSLQKDALEEPISYPEIQDGKDDEWNQKILEFLSEGRLEDVGQLSRTIQQQIRVQKVVNFKPMWWLK